MMDQNQIDTSVLYGNDEMSIIENSLGIMGHLVRKYNDPNMLDNMSIDKTDSVLRVLESANKLVSTLSTNKLRLMGMKSESDDRSRMVAILKDISLRNRTVPMIADRKFDIDDSEVDVGSLNLGRGELSQGVEQLTLELLEYEKMYFNHIINNIFSLS